jgi:SAM-dependent methyltransferase
LGCAERRFRSRVAAEAEEVSLSEADAYDRFMGRYSRPLAVPFADFVRLPLDGRVLDVGCGPGALTAELARRSRPERVTAVDPSEEFVAAYMAAIPEWRSSARRLRICRLKEAASMRRSPSSWSTSWTIRSQASARWRG